MGLQKLPGGLTSQSGKWLVRISNQPENYFSEAKQIWDESYHRE